jgi:hypothetical protein
MRWASCLLFVGAWALCLSACPLEEYPNDFGEECLVGGPDSAPPCSEGLVCKPDDGSELGGFCLPPDEDAPGGDS